MLQMVAAYSPIAHRMQPCTWLVIHLQGQCSTLISEGEMKISPLVFWLAVNARQNALQWTDHSNANKKHHWEISYTNWTHLSIHEMVCHLRWISLATKKPSVFHWLLEYTKMQLGKTKPNKPQFQQIMLTFCRQTSKFLKTLKSYCRSWAHIKYLQPKLPQSDHSKMPSISNVR